jgi:GxxExxY protein
MAGLHFERQVPLRLTYRDVVISCVYRVDLIVEHTVLVEVKAVDRILSVHHAQVMTYLRLSGLHHGLLLNFNASRLVEGLTSFLV